MSKKNLLLWILAIVLTLIFVVYQRRTGPTYPVRGNILVGEEKIAFSLKRSEVTNHDHLVKISVENRFTQGKILWRRYKAEENWQEIDMKKEGNSLTGLLPKQPPAGKLEYEVLLNQNGKEIPLTQAPIIIRFKGYVSPYLLIPHILLMFGWLLFSVRAGLAAVGREKKAQKLALYTTAMLFVGGILFGVFVQYYAFGAFWTGFPVGKDLTDTKTLVALMAWILALYQNRHGQRPYWIVIAALITLAVYLIPHSLLGSELSYAKQPM